MIGAAAVTTGVVLQNEQAKKANAIQQQAMQNAKQAADKQASDQEQAFNKANAKTPDLSAIMANAQQRGGPSGTMLTGPSGIDPSALNLSKNTLLGM